MPILMGKYCDFDLQTIKKKIGESTTWHPSNISENILTSESLNKAAVLVPLVVCHDEVNLLFTHRSSSLERHSSQVSFPGGIFENDDKSLIDTALRETREEIGVDKKNIQVIGQLPSFNTSTGYIVYPVIGVIDSLDNIRINEIEVNKVFYIPLDWLCNPNHSKLENYVTVDGTNRKVWFFDQYEGESVWGITAKIIFDLIEILKR